ncbi:MAG: hypothetical protein RL026_1114 [Pseudomonadota bacterium]|jgi:hypothetical protein
MQGGSGKTPVWWAATPDPSGRHSVLPPPSHEPSLQVLTSLEEFRRATRRAFDQSQRLVSVLADQLDPALYDDPAVLESAKRFLISRRYSRLRVLLRRPPRLMGRAGRFVGMARRLTANVEFRTVPASEIADATQYLIGDDSVIVYQVRNGAWDGVAGYDAPTKLRICLAQFDRLWTCQPPV